MNATGDPNCAACHEQPGRTVKWCREDDACPRRIEAAEAERLDAEFRMLRALPANERSALILQLMRVLVLEVGSLRAERDSQRAILKALQSIDESLKYGKVPV